MSKLNFRVLYPPKNTTMSQEHKKTSDELNPIFHEELTNTFIGALISGQNPDSYLQKLAEEDGPECANLAETNLPQNLQVGDNLKVTIIIDPTESGEPSEHSVFDAQDYDEICQKLHESQPKESENGAEEEKVHPEIVEEDLNDKVDFLAYFNNDKVPKRKRPEDAKRNNVLYKAVFRDFRKFIVRDFEEFFKRYLPILKTQVSFMPRYKKKYAQMKQPHRKKVLPILMEQYVEEGQSPLFKDLIHILNPERKKMMIHVLAAIISLKDYQSCKLGREGKSWKRGIRLMKSMKISKSKNTSLQSKTISEIVNTIEHVLKIFSQAVVPDFLDIPFIKNFLWVYTKNPEERVDAHKAMKRLPEKYI